MTYVQSEYAYCAVVIVTITPIVCCGLYCFLFLFLFLNTHIIHFVVDIATMLAWSVRQTCLASRFWEWSSASSMSILLFLPLPGDPPVNKDLLIKFEPSSMLRKFGYKLKQDLTPLSTALARPSRPGNKSFVLGWYPCPSCRQEILIFFFESSQVLRPGPFGKLRRRGQFLDWTTCYSIEIMSTIPTNEHMLNYITFTGSQQT